jgi:hypothetical protein
MNNKMLTIKSGTPVNAVNATKTLTISGVVVDGETVTIDNPLFHERTDVYEFTADTLKTKTLPTNKVVDIMASTTKSSGTLTIPTQPIAGDTMTIGTKLYTFVAHGTAEDDGDIDIGTTLASAKLNIVAAINGTDLINTPHTRVSASAFNVNVCTITALVGGVLGDAIATTETFDAVGNVFAAVTLESGADCSATNAAVALGAAITAVDSQGVAGIKGTGDTVVLTADVAGVTGNDIVIGHTMAHGAFAGAATKLSGGVNGTVGLQEQLLYDSTYLYVCIANNKIFGKNWRRISLGTVY